MNNSNETRVLYPGTKVACLEMPNGSGLLEDLSEIRNDENFEKKQCANSVKERSVFDSESFDSELLSENEKEQLKSCLNEYDDVFKEKVIKEILWSEVLIYLDDVIVVARTFDEYLSCLRNVFNRLRAANLKLKPQKCKFGQEKVRFLGHVVTPNGVTTDPKKCEAIQKIYLSLTELKNSDLFLISQITILGLFHDIVRSLAPLPFDTKEYTICVDSWRLKS